LLKDNYFLFLGAPNMGRMTSLEYVIWGMKRLCWVPTWPRPGSPSSLSFSKEWGRCGSNTSNQRTQPCCGRLSQGVFFSS